MYQLEWSRVLRWGAVSAINFYLLLAVGLASLVHSFAQMQPTHRVAQMLYTIPTIPSWYQWVPHESRLGDFSILRDVVIVNQFPTSLALLTILALLGGFTAHRIRRIWTQARNRQAVANDEQLREEYRKRQQVIVNVPDHNEDIAQLKDKMDKLEDNNEALLTVLKEVLQKDEPAPKKRSIGFVEPQDKPSPK